MNPDNAYAELGLDPGASEDEVKAAWRRLASHWHPDRNRSAAAIGKMQRINQAIEQIRRSDAGDKGLGREAPADAHTDADADADADAAHAAPETSRSKAKTISRKVNLTLEEAAAGCVKVLRGGWSERCSPCAGAGFRSVGGVCPDCDGAGTVRQRAWFGWSGAPTACAACSGEGVVKQKCEACHGSGKLTQRAYRMNVRIPHGVRDGDQLQVDQRAERAGHPAVQLNLRVKLLPHAFFELADDGTVHCEVPVDGFAWIANRTIDVPTLNGMQRLQMNRDRLTYRLSGQGFPTERRGPCGDLLVTVLPVFPERLGADQEILLDQLIASSSGPAGSATATRLGHWRRAVQAWEQGRAARGR